jgi:lipase
VSRTLHLHAWGPEAAEPVVCLHGVTGWGGHFARLAELALSERRVLAPDLLGHGRSPAEPPWSLDAQIEAVLATVGPIPRTWIGHSYGGRIAWELAARRPEVVETLVLLDPAIVPGMEDVLLHVAEDARTRRTYADLDDLVDRRFAESMLVDAPRELVEADVSEHVVEVEGGLEYRYVQSAVVTTYSEIAAPPAAPEQIGARVLLVRGEESYVPLTAALPTLAAALGDRLEVAVVPGGHTVFWDALAETAAAIAAFLGPADDGAEAS